MSTGRLSFPTGQVAQGASAVRAALVAEAAWAELVVRVASVVAAAWAELAAPVELAAPAE